MRRGFSLIEILIVVVIGFSIVLVVSQFSNNINILNGLVNVGLQSKSDISQTLQIMTTEIRSATMAQNGAYAIDTATTSSFGFYSDINKNGTVEHVRYFLASSSLWKGVVIPTGTPAQYVTSSEVLTDVADGVMVGSSTPLFQYYDASYTGTQAPLAQPVTVSSIRLVGIAFSVTTKASSSPSSTTAYQTLVDIRNLRSN